MSGLSASSSSILFIYVFSSSCQIVLFQLKYILLFECNVNRLRLYRSAALVPPLAFVLIGSLFSSRREFVVTVFHGIKAVQPRESCIGCQISTLN